METLTSPVTYLASSLDKLPHEDVLRAYEAWWAETGTPISAAVDRAGTPWLRNFDRFGRRVDEIGFPPDYWTALRRGYEAGVIWRVLEERSLVPSYLLGYVTSFYDAGIYCPYTVSLSTAVPLAKYGSADLKDAFLTPMRRADGANWQGATWMTEVGGGSDLGRGVETSAQPDGDRWRLDGEKYFASNVGAELAVVAARPEGAPDGIRGIGLFLVPKHREDGSLNYRVRRLKDKIATRSVPTGEVELVDSEAYLLGEADQGVYLVLEVLNLSRVANSVGSVGLMQRAIAEALRFAQGRVAFGKPIQEHPLLDQQIRERTARLSECFALAWEAVRLLDEVWRETPPYSDRYHLFRLVAHLAKYWTAEQAVQTAKWAMEVHGGAGVLGEHPAERWLREAMILSIWEGTPHRQILDGLEAMERKGAHRLLAEHLANRAGTASSISELIERADAHLARSEAEREAHAEALFRDLARTTAETLAQGSPRS